MVHKLLKLSRKYLRKVTSTFLALYLMFSPLFAFPTDLFAATEVVVTPSNLQGWSEYVTSDGTTELIFSTGAPSGVGSLKLTTHPSDNNSRANLVRSVANIPLADVQELSYKTKQNNAIVPEGNAAYKITIDGDGNPATTTDKATLVFEPYWENGLGDPYPVVPGIWQTWNVYSGLFWASIPGGNSVPGLVNGAGGPPHYTLAEVLALNPNATIEALWVGIGSYNLDYDIEVDDYVFGYDSGSGLVSTSWNFEPYVPVPADSNFVYSERYIRQNNFVDVAAGVRVPISATDVRFSVYDSSSTLIGTYDTNGDSSDTGDDNNVFKIALIQGGLQVWRFKKSLPAGAYTASAEYEIGGTWYPVTGGPAIIYALSNPTLQIVTPNDSKHVFRASDKNIIRLRVSDAYNSFDRATFEVDSVIYNITRDLCNLSQAGNYVLCDLGDAIEWDGSIAEGTYIGKVQAWNKANGRANVSPISTRDFTIDKTAPNVSNFVAPAMSAAGTVLSADVTDFVGIDIVRFYISERTLADECKNNLASIRTVNGVKDPLSDTYYATIDTSDLNGNYCVLVSARDLAANNSTPLFKEIVFDNTAPTTPKWLHSPMITHNGDALLTDPLRRLEMRFTESTDMIGSTPNPGGVDHYEYSFVRRDLNGTFMGASASVNMNTYGGGIACDSGECVWKPDAQANRQWVYRMRAVDQLGNKSAWSNWNDASDSEFMSFDFDYSDMVDGTGIFARSDFDTSAGNTGYTLREAIAPESNITSTDEITNSPSVSIVYEAQDGESELKKVELWYSYNGNPYALLTEAVTNSTSGSFNLSLTDGDGDYCFYTIAEDVADDGILDAGEGNREDIPADPCELEIRLDTQAPVVGPVSVLLDFLAAYVNGNTGFVLGASVSDSGVGLDSSTCEVTIDGLTWIPGSILLGNCYTTVPSLPDAQELFLNVRIKDLAGNETTGVEIERTSDAALPTTTVDIVENFYGPNTFNIPTTTIVGTADDSVSGIADVKLTIQRSSDNRYYVSGFWLPVSSHLLGQTPSFTPTTSAGTVDWAYGGGFGMANGVTYTVRAYARDNVNLVTYGSTAADSFTWDSQEPMDPDTFSSDPSISTFSNDNTVEVTFSGAHDYGLSGVAGYYYTFSNVQETPADIPANWIAHIGGDHTVTSDPLADGEWWFNVRTVDNVGNITSTAHYGPFWIDTENPSIVFDAPGDNAITNVLMLTGIASDTVVFPLSNDIVSVELDFRDSSDVSVFTCTADYEPLVDSWYADETHCALPDGEYSRVIATASDKAGNTSSDEIINFVYDTLAPTDPSLFTSSHPENVSTSLSVISIEWPAVGELGGAEDSLSGVSGYSWEFSQDPVTLPDDVQEQDETVVTAVSSPLADGEYYFHLRTVDSAGNWTSTVHYGPMTVDTTAPTIVLLGDNPVTLTEGDVYTDAGAQAFDNIDGDITVEIVTTNPVDTNTPGTYTVTYNVLDSAGNPATPVTRTVIVQEAPEEPEGEVLGEQDNNLGNTPLQTQNLQDEEGDNEEEGEVLGLVCDVRQNMTGYVYIDRNGNGVRDEGDEGLEGVRVRIIYLDNGEEVVVDTLRTDANGRWKTEVCPGEYEVRIDRDTLPNGVELEGEDTLGVTVGDDSGEHNINFTLTEGNDDSGFDFRWILLVIVVGGLVLLAWRKYSASKNAPIGY